jgi:hypothetical protein
MMTFWKARTFDSNRQRMRNTSEDCVGITDVEDILPK